MASRVRARESDARPRTAGGPGRGARIRDELQGLVLVSAALLLVTGSFVEDRGLVHAGAVWIRHLVGGSLWYLVVLLVHLGVRRFRSLPMWPSRLSLAAWLFILPVVCGSLQALTGLLGGGEPGGRLGWLVFNYLALLTSPVSACIVLLVLLLVALMLALELPLSELTASPGRAVLAIVSSLLFVVWVPALAIQRAVRWALFKGHRVAYWIIEDLSTIGEYLTRRIFAPRRRTTGRLPALAQPPAAAPVAAEAPSAPPEGPADPSAPQAPAPAIVAYDDEDPVIEDEDGPAAAPEAKEAPKRRPRRRRQPSTDEPPPSADESPADEPPGDEPPGDDEPARDTLGRLRLRAQAAAPGAQLRLFTGTGSPKEPASSGWRLPPLDLLVPPPAERTGEDDGFLRTRGEQLIETLAQFKIEAEVLKIVAGPTITQYQIKPASGVKLTRITALANDIAMALACRSVRIEAPIPGQAAVGIEVPNENPEAVLFSEMVASPRFAQAQERTKLVFALGKSINGKPVIADLRKMPHLLVAGATNSGKSVCINTILSSILYTASPQEVRVLLIDPKMVELVAYNGIPHLVTDVVTNATDAATALRWAVLEMERRYQYLSRFGVRNLESYNEHVLAGKLVDEEGEPVLDAVPMPYMVVIIDELADLMMVAAKEIEGHICRLAQMARAVGMHLIVATQRPSTNVITGVIKANLPSRISFAVSSKVDSKVILDHVGAEALLGRGDMLYQPVGEPKPVRLQGAFVSEDEVKRLVGFLREHGETDYVDIHGELVESAASAEAGGGGGGDTTTVDDQWEAALRLAIDLGDISTSLVQRHLQIGYNRAARIVDAMFERGIISGQESGRRRKVLISEEQISDYI